MRWIFTLSPVYCVVNSIVWSSSSELVITVRNNPSIKPGSPVALCGPVPTGLWDIENLAGDTLMLSLNAILGLIILTLIELRLCQSCRKMTFATLPEPISTVNLKQDDDV